MRDKIRGISVVSLRCRVCREVLGGCGEDISLCIVRGVAHQVCFHPGRGKLVGMTVHGTRSGKYVKHTIALL